MPKIGDSGETEFAPAAANQATQGAVEREQNDPHLKSPAGRP